ncbi:MAG TPA: BON domain-containing protein [Vicinamibacterales bacterium]|jgi:osmotically-inducible protein OsmY
MSTATLTDQDRKLRNAVLEQLEWDPAVDASGVGVTAYAGAVALTGSINTYAGKLAAERAARQVRGVRAVANDLEVALIAGQTDADIAADAAAVLRLHDAIPQGVQATVHHGQLRLTGTVPWHYLYIEAERAVRHIRGVRQVINDITIAPPAAGRDLKHRIAQALYRNAGLDAKRIEVTVSDHIARLTGTATSWQQRQAAERAAYDAPGITIVDNQVVVEPPDGDNCEIC